MDFTPFFKVYFFTSALERWWGRLAYGSLQSVAPFHLCYEVLVIMKKNLGIDFIFHTQYDEAREL